MSEVVGLKAALIVVDAVNSRGTVIRGDLVEGCLHRRLTAVTDVI